MLFSLFKYLLRKIHHPLDNAIISSYKRPYAVFFQAYEARIIACVAISEELDKEEYHDVQRILVK